MTRPDRRGWTSSVTIASVFFILATAILYFPRETTRYHQGEKAKSDLRSPVEFVDNDPSQQQRMRETERIRSKPVLVENAPATDRIRNQLLNLQQDVKGYPNVESLPADIQQRWPNLTQRSLDWLQKVDPRIYNSEVLSFVSSLSNAPLIDPAAADKIAQRKSPLVALAQTRSLDAITSDIFKTRIVPLHTTDPVKRQHLISVIMGAFPKDLADPIASFLLNNDQPTFIYDQALTNQLADRVAAAVQPEGVKIEANEIIVQKDELITPELSHRLELAQDTYDRNLAHAYPWAWVLSRLGQAMSVLLLTIIGALYVTKLNRKQNTIPRGWALVGLLLLTLFIAKAALNSSLYNAIYMVGVAPTLLATVILVIAYNQRFALVMGCLHALLVTQALGQGADFFLTILAGIAVFTFGLKEIRTRGKLIEVGVFAAIALLIAVWGLGMARFAGSIWNIRTIPYAELDTAIKDIGWNSLWAALAGVSVGFITLGILPFIERVFKITTAMTLLELCDLNQPLLRRLGAESPGTFNHSLILGTLAEAAGNAIGANGLLCRVGAYYHDIGKLSKPHYFVENQSGGANRHDKISPAMSLLIIVGHVKDGIELAREKHLPRVIHQFIAEHHGTTLVEYFYHAAKERQARERDADETPVSETEFRYPGPKPQSRETAILMICDGCEGAVRSLAEPTPGRIETIVHQIIMKRLMDNQFSECDLTLRDLSQIEQSLVRTLAAVHHGRIAYPKSTPVSQPA